MREITLQLVASLEGVATLTAQEIRHLVAERDKYQFLAQKETTAERMALLEVEEVARGLSVETDAARGRVIGLVGDAKDAELLLNALHALDKARG